MSIRLAALRAHNVGPFTDIAVDLDAMPGTLIAVCGENGAGKSTLLELFAGAMYRRCPTRGTLADLATARDSFVEATVVNGASYRIRQDVDAISGKGEALVRDLAGAAVLPDTKVKSFDTWATTHLPSPEVLFASTFAAQGSGGFLDLKEGDRKAVLLRVLGIERLEGLAKAARDEASAAKAAITTLDARLIDERARSGDLDAANNGLSAATAAAVEAKDALDFAKEGLRAWEAERTVLDAAQLEQTRHAARAAELDGQIAEEAKALADAQARLTNNRNTLARGDEIRAAVARRAAIVAEIQALEIAASNAESRVREASAAANAAASALTAAQAATRQAQARLDDATRRRDEAKKRTADRAVVLGAIEQAKGATVAVERAKATLDEATVELDAVRSQRALGAEGREKALRGHVDTMIAVEHPDGSEMRGMAQRAAAENGAAVELAATLPGRTKAAEAAVAKAKATLVEAEAALAKAQAVAARLPAIEAAEVELSASEQAITDASGPLADAMANQDRAAADVAMTKAAVSALDGTGATERAAIAKLRAESDGLAPAADLLTRLDAATDRIAELTGLVEGAEKRIAALRAERAQVPTAEARAALRPRPDVAAVEAAKARAEEGATLARAAVARAEEGAARVAVLETERQAARDEQDDWALLADAFGRDGIQAAEIDAAGPELTALINDLLHTCVTTRWTVTLDTQKASSDGKRTLEGLDVRVLDTEKGRDATADSLSGGERVLVGEAISLALTMLACRRSGVVGPTIVRDETGAALDPVRGRAYIAMLRRAAEIVGASKVLYVSHVPAIAEMADARIVVAGGTAVVS